MLDLAGSNDKSFNNKIKTIGCILSISTSLISVFFYWLLKQNRNFILSNIIILSITNSLFCISMLIPLKPDYALLCSIQAFSLNSFQLAQFICSCVIGYCCFITVIRKNHLDKFNLVYRTTFYLLEFGIPIILSSIIIYTKSYGDSGVFCWLDIGNKNKRTFISKLALIIFSTVWLLLILNMYFIVKLIAIILKTKISSHIYIRMIIFQIVILLSAIPSTVNRLYAIFNKQKNIYTFTVIQTFFETYCGFIVNILFLSSPWIKDYIVNVFYSLRSNPNMNEGIAGIQNYKEGLSTSSSKVVSIK